MTVDPTTAATTKENKLQQTQVFGIIFTDAVHPSCMGVAAGVAADGVVSCFSFVDVVVVVVVVVVDVVDVVVVVHGVHGVVVHDVVHDVADNDDDVAVVVDAVVVLVVVVVVACCCCS